MAHVTLSPAARCATLYLPQCLSTPSPHAAPYCPFSLTVPVLSGFYAPPGGGGARPSRAGWRGGGRAPPPAPPSAAGRGGHAAPDKMVATRRAAARRREPEPRGGTGSGSPSGPADAAEVRGAGSRRGGGGWGAGDRVPSALRGGGGPAAAIFTHTRGLATRGHPGGGRGRWSPPAPCGSVAAAEQGRQWVGLPPRRCRSGTLP